MTDRIVIDLGPPYQDFSIETGIEQGRACWFAVAYHKGDSSERPFFNKHYDTNLGVAVSKAMTELAAHLSRLPATSMLFDDREPKEADAEKIGAEEMAEATQQDNAQRAFSRLVESWERLPKLVQEQKAAPAEEQAANSVKPGSVTEEDDPAYAEFCKMLNSTKTDKELFEMAARPQKEDEPRTDAATQPANKPAEVAKISLCHPYEGFVVHGRQIRSGEEVFWEAQVKTRDGGISFPRHVCATRTEAVAKAVVEAFTCLPAPAETEAAKPEQVVPRVWSDALTKVDLVEPGEAKQSQVRIQPASRRESSLGAPYEGFSLATWTDDLPVLLDGGGSTEHVCHWFAQVVKQDGSRPFPSHHSRELLTATVEAIAELAAWKEGQERTSKSELNGVIEIENHNVRLAKQVIDLILGYLQQPSYTRVVSLQRCSKLHQVLSMLDGVFSQQGTMLAENACDQQTPAYASTTTGLVKDELEGIFEKVLPRAWLEVQPETRSVAAGVLCREEFRLGPPYEGFNLVTWSDNVVRITGPAAPERYWFAQVVKRGESLSLSQHYDKELVPAVVLALAELAAWTAKQASKPDIHSRQAAEGLRVLAEPVE